MNNILKMNNMITEEIEDANPGEARLEMDRKREIVQAKADKVLGKLGEAVELPLEAYQISGTAPIDYKNTNGGNPQ